MRLHVPGWAHVPLPSTTVWISLESSVLETAAWHVPFQGKANVKTPFLPPIHIPFLRLVLVVLGPVVFVPQFYWGKLFGVNDGPGC